MRILTVVPECFPYVKTGGLADVASSLPRALAGRGHDVAILLPGYPAVLMAARSAEVVDRYDELYGGPARVLRVHGPPAEPCLLVVDAPHLFDRPGHPYLAPDQREWGDNAIRFAAVCVVGREIGVGRLADWRPDVVHAHDWQTGLVPAYLALDGRPRPATVFTVHNLGFQGQFTPEWLDLLGLPADAFAVAGVEYYGGIGFLKAGLYYADKITTVSPTYAREIQSVDWGMGLGGLLAGRAADLSGIVNGIDTDLWDPARDADVEPGYDATSLQVRDAHKAALQRLMQLDERADLTLFCAITRLTWQKGMDVLLPALPSLVASGGQLVMLATGDGRLEAGFVEAAVRHPGRIAVRIGHDESLAHRAQAGSDALLMPSRFEPCGLTQLQALRYGCVPVVARTGGLLDTVVDADEPGGTGIMHDSGRTDRLIDAIQRTIALRRDQPRWRDLQVRGMGQDLSWARPARAYEGVYAAALTAAHRAREGSGDLDLCGTRS